MTATQVITESQKRNKKSSFFIQGIQGNIGAWGEVGPRGGLGDPGPKGPTGPLGVPGYPVCAFQFFNEKYAVNILKNWLGRICGPSVQNTLKSLFWDWSCIKWPAQSEQDLPTKDLLKLLQHWQDVLDSKILLQLFPLKSIHGKHWLISDQYSKTTHAFLF